MLDSRVALPGRVCTYRLSESLMVQGNCALATVGLATRATSGPTLATRALSSPLHTHVTALVVLARGTSHRHHRALQFRLCHRPRRLTLVARPRAFTKAAMKC